MFCQAPDDSHVKFSLYINFWLTTFDHEGAHLSSRWLPNSTLHIESLTYLVVIIASSDFFRQYEVTSHL